MCAMIRISQTRIRNKPTLTLADEWDWGWRIARPIDDPDDAVWYRRCDSGFVPVVFHLYLELTMRHT